MNAKIKTNTIVKESSNAAIDSISRATITGMAVISGLVGVWALASLVSAFVSNGPGAMLRGLVTAVTGM